VALVAFHATGDSVLRASGVHNCSITSKLAERGFEAKPCNMHRSRVDD
jgi:hypothetical protein